MKVKKLVARAQGSMTVKIVDRVDELIYTVDSNTSFDKFLENEAAELHVGMFYIEGEELVVRTRERLS